MFAHIISDISQPVLESWVLTSMDAESAALQAAEIEALQVLFLQVSLPGCNPCCKAAEVKLAAYHRRPFMNKNLSW